MSCELLAEGIPKDCDNNIGGIKKFWATEKANVLSLALSSPDEIINVITMSGVTKFYEFEFNKNTSSYTEVTSSDQSIGVEISVQTVTLILNRREKTKRDILLLLGKFKDLCIIIKDSNDVNWFLGENNGMNLTVNDGGSGVARTDPNRYTLTFVGEEPAPANTVIQSAIDAVI